VAVLGGSEAWHVFHSSQFHDILGPELGDENPGLGNTQEHEKMTVSMVATLDSFLGRRWMSVTRSLGVVSPVA
jgi:hypothetical protein